jgi:hypothetical protein
MVISNESKEPWGSSVHDEAALKQAETIGCTKWTNGRSPCVRVFIKVAPQTYRTVCAQEDKVDKFKPKDEK